MARQHADKAAAAKRQMREGLVAAVATMIRAGDTVAAATTAPRSAIRNLLSRARTRTGRSTEQARPRRARKVAAKESAREDQTTVRAPDTTSSRDVARPRKRGKSDTQRKPSRRRAASASGRSRPS